jgi:hypothetical protein
LDQLKNENLAVEQEQINLLKTIGMVERDIAIATGEQAELR